MGTYIVVGNIRFETKEAAIAHCRVILHSDALDTEIMGDDAVFVEAVLHARPDKLAELGDRKIVRYLRKMHRHNTPCFFAELDDKTFLDISFMKLINSYPRSAA